MTRSPGRHAARSRNPLRLLAGAGAPLRGAVVTAVLSLGAVALLATAAAVVLLHLTTHTVLTGSMRGTFDPGALVIAREVPATSVQPGDVIVFTPPGGTTAFTHRVQTVAPDPAGPVVTTKGDANPAPDAWKARLASPTVPKVVAHVPALGGWLLSLQARGLRPVLLGLLGLLVAVSGTRMILGSPTPRRSHRSAPRVPSPSPAR